MPKSIKNNELNAELLYEEMPYKIKGAVIICAGGAYVWLSPREEWPVANAYAAYGYQTFIVDFLIINSRPFRGGGR